MTELDKFKRRTIRSVSRMLQQKKPPDELWAEMKKELGTDCRVLWERMRALCIKKLNRMLAVDDRSDSLPTVARLTLTDWLLVDLVLVHERIDVIAMDKEDSKAEQKPLVELFNLVQRFEVEGHRGESLAEAWAAATVFYNRQGRQCSPMLLQRRWYQLKKLTRCRFYKFWQSYRGNTRLLDVAKATMPSRLQMAIAKRYPSVITKPFPEWEELIKERLIVMPEEFEAKMRLPNLPKPCKSNDPDLVVVEPLIETIDLRVDSDPEDESKDDNDVDTSDHEKSNDATQVQFKGILGVKIKTEPIEEDGLSNVQLVAATHVPEVDIGDDDNPEPVIEPNTATHVPEVGIGDDDNPELVIEPNTASHVLEVDIGDDDNPESVIEPNTATHVPEVDIGDDDNPEPFIEPNKETEDKEKQIDTPDIEDDVIEIPSVIPVVDIDLETPANNAADKPQEEILETSSPDYDMPVNDNDDEVDDFIKIKADEFCSNKPNEVPEVTNVESLVDYIIKDKIDNFLNTPKDEIIIEKKPDVADLLNEKSNLTAMDLMADLNFVDDGIEFVDDGVEFVEEYDEPNKEPVKKSPSGQDKNEDSVNKFDLKLLMDPVVYTTRLDQMNIFSDKQFDSVDNLEIIEKVFAESKPVSKKSFNINIKQEDKTSQIDADDSGTNDDLFTNREESSDEDIPDSTRVSITSNMLRKPKSRSYNPIQLCKNPDFNTKLRRLNIGFFSSTRNRMLLNACIPMTIDVSKSFESRMVDGTLYLKNTGPSVKVEPKEVVDIQTPSVVPMTMPVQSQLDKVLTNIQDLMPSPTITTPDPIVSERKKIISLPDIEKVRKINQQLLTAQVPPIRVYAGDSHRLPQAIPVVDNSVEEIKLTEPPIPTPHSEPPNVMPTVVKVKSEANLDNESVPLRPETPPPELPPAKKKLVKIINRAKVLTQQALAKIDDGRKTSENNELKQVTFLREVVLKPKPKLNKAGKKCNVNQVAVPWTSRGVPQRPEQIDDFLITSDTLNKMLHLMGKDTQDTNCTCCASKPKYPKKKYKKSKEKSSKSSQDGQIDSDRQVIARGRVFKYCCWARQKIAKRKRITEHTCPPGGCVCCCRDELAKLVQQNLQKSDAIELSDDEDVNLQKACQSIENVVQQSRDMTPRAVVIENVYGIDSDSLGLDIDLEGVAANETIIEVPAAPSNVPALRSSVDVPSVTVNLDTPTPQIKFNVQTVKTPFRVTAEPAPLRVTAEPAPFRVTAEPAPRNVTDEQTLQNVMTVQSLLTVTADQAPLNVAPVQTPLNVAPLQTPLNVTAGHTPLNVTSLETPLDVVAATDLVSVQTETSTPHISQTPTLANSQAPPLFVKNVRTRIVSELPKVNPGPRKIADSPRSVRCLCQKPAVSQDARRNIVIDASKQCPLHRPAVPLVTPLTPVPIAPKNESKVLYLNSNSIAKSPTESPIYLGKNKILLTTVKFPRKNPDVIPESEVLQPPKIIPTFEVPPGVHLVLLASGCVTYTLDQGKVLSEAEQERLPSIIAAVQEQLSSAVPSVIAPVNNDINSTNTNSSNATPEVNVNAQTTESQVPINLEAQEVFQDDQLPAKVPENGDAVSIASTPIEGAVESNAIPETQPDEISHSIVKENECTPSNEATVNKTDENTHATLNDTPLVSNVISPILNEPEPLETQPEKDITDAGVENNKEASEKDESIAKEVASNRKSLLSDLMEMSGISAEDTTVVEAPTPVQQVTENQMSNVILNVNPELTKVGPGIVSAVLTADQTKSLPELSPVTSFAELKYACEQNGKFFKLDYETGIIVPINVCIKKNIKRKIQDKPKAIIDLTDDVDDENDTNNTTSNSLPTAQYIYNGKTVNVSVKPVKLFKACRPPLLKRSKLLDNTDIPIPRKKTHFENRKQALHRLEARIDLVDSDEPMEEEYLMDSSDDEVPLLGMESMHVEALDLGILEDSDDSSDDEPLAKKSKRLKESQTETAVNTIETNIRLAIDSLEENVLAPEADVSENTSKYTVTPMIYEDLPSEVNNREDNDDRPVLKFMSGATDDEGGEDDCILGV